MEIQPCCDIWDSSACLEGRYQALTNQLPQHPAGGLSLSAPTIVSSVQLLSCDLLFETPQTAANQASLSITNSRSLPKLMSFESVMPSNNLILCRPLLLLHSIFPSIGVFSNESPFHSRWPKYCGPFQNLMDRQLENFSWNFIKKKYQSSFFLPFIFFRDMTTSYSQNIGLILYPS